MKSLSNRIEYNDLAYESYHIFFVSLLGPKSSISCTSYRKETGNLISIVLELLSSFDCWSS